MHRDDQRSVSAAWEGVGSIHFEDKLNLPVHVLVVDGLALFEIHPPAHL